MAFKSKDLSVLAYANGFTLWHYTSVDLTADMDTAGYFNDASDIVRIGDIVLVNASTDNIITSCIYQISVNGGGVVGIVNMTTNTV